MRIRNSVIASKSVNNFKVRISNFNLNLIGIILNSIIQDSIKIQNFQFETTKTGSF